MGTRQYIGARYVPKFFDNNGSAEWVSGIQYEPLTIVTYLGNSFTSKIPVPANIGAPNTAPEYWVATGTYNQQIEELREEVENAIGDVVEEVDDVKNDGLKGKTIVILGDSNALLWANTNPFADTGATVVNLTHGGAGFSNLCETTIMAQYQSMVSMGIVPDYCIIWAGGNDLVPAAPNFGLPKFGDYSQPTDEAKTFDALRRLLYNFRNYYPSVKLFGIVKNDQLNAVVGKSRSNYVYGMIEKIYADWSVPVLSFDSISNISQEVYASKNEYYSDNLHFNQNAFAIFTRQITNAIKGGLVTHKARTVNCLFAPSDKNNGVAAGNWVIDELFNGVNYHNWQMAFRSYRVFYLLENSEVYAECAVTIFESNIGLISIANDGLYLRNNKSSEYYGRNHKVLTKDEATGHIGSLNAIPDGIVDIGVGQLDGTTAGVPSAIATALAASPWVLSGCWRSNGFYKGILYNPHPEFVSQTTGRILLVMGFPISGGTKWNFTDLSNNTWNADDLT